MQEVGGPQAEPQGTRIHCSRPVPLCKETLTLLGGGPASTAALDSKSLIMQVEKPSQAGVGLISGVLRIPRKYRDLAELQELAFLVE